MGAGPAGLFLAHLLRAEGIDAVVVEQRDRAYVEGRVRAGVLEPVAVDLLTRLGLGARVAREGLRHGGFTIADGCAAVRIDLAALTGRQVTVYGQQEVMKDLFDAADARGLTIVFDAEDVRLENLDGERPAIVWRRQGRDERLACDFVVGCDGYHGICRRSIPADVLKVFERVYPFAWLGVLADVPPASDELVYARHENGFALASMRSSTRSRYYIQCSLETRLEDWPDERFWDEVCLRLGKAGGQVTRGPAFEKGLAPLRSFVAEPMRWGRLFLAGDAAHIVPPTGAKGLNLAVSDVLLLAEALAEFYADGRPAGLDAYSGRALGRVWQAQRFSWWFTGLTHRFPQAGPVEARLQDAELAYLRRSPAAQAALAENYVGLPFDGGVLSSTS